MNFDICRHMLLNANNEENEPQAGSDAPVPLKREFQQAMRDTLLSPAAGIGVGRRASSEESGGAKGAGRKSGGIAPRVLSFSERPPAPQERCPNVLKVNKTHGLSMKAVDCRAI